MANLYTLRDLAQRTEDVIREIAESGEPAVITRHGRFLALITPLTDKQVESEILGRGGVMTDRSDPDDTHCATCGYPNPRYSPLRFREGEPKKSDKYGLWLSLGVLAATEAFIIMAILHKAGWW